MFITYKHAELPLGELLGDPRVQHWQFVEQDVHWPWFYMEFVRDLGEDCISSMLMIPTVPALEQLLDEQNERSWLAQALLVTPGHLNGSKAWMMEPLVEVSVALDEEDNQLGYVYKVEAGHCYSTHPGGKKNNLLTSHVIFSADKHLRR
ncbi:hypothetical protein D3C84_435430 [compost metagenome]